MDYLKLQMNKIQSDFINYELNNYNSLGNLDDQYINSISKYASKQFELLDQTEKVKYYYENFFVKDSSIVDYCNKIIKVPNQGMILTQLRFKGLDIIYPFIEIVFSNFKIDENNIRLVYSLIIDNYKSIKIEWIRFFSTSIHFSKEINNVDKLLYAKYYIGVFDIKSQQSYIYIEKPKDNDDFYEEYLKEYNSVNKDLAQPLKFEYIKELILDNLFFLIKYNTDVIGTIAIDKKYVNSIIGYEIIDEIIYEKFRGKSFAKFAQNLLINDVILRKSNVLILGTIHPDNIPSIKTAESNGRICLGKWIFYKNN